jgi:hypothetical protein
LLVGDDKVVGKLRHDRVDTRKVQPGSLATEVGDPSGIDSPFGATRKMVRSNRSRAIARLPLLVRRLLRIVDGLAGYELCAEVGDGMKG